MISRRVALALGLSLLLHVGALLVFALRPAPVVEATKAPSRPVVVTIPVGLREPARVERPVAPPGVDVASGEAALPPPLPRRAAVAPAAEPAGRAVVGTGPEAPPGTGEGASPGAVTEGQVGGAQGSGGAPERAAGAALGGGGRAVLVDPGVEAAVHARLQAAAASCTPAAAQRLKVTGTATVRFCLGPDGAVGETVLQVTSGQSMLDEAARTCVVERAVPFPEQAAGRCFTVPVRFGAR